MTARVAFVRACLALWDEPVLWGELDCSDLPARGEIAVGLPDRRATYRAQTYADTNLEGAETPSPGDLGFYGRDWQHVIHVVVAIDSTHVLSADGASSHGPIPGARVRIHTGTRWYGSAPFLGWRRHSELDQPKEG